jgi:ubiquinone/menaquinone biosynthesis C-methylase UbiE
MNKPADHNEHIVEQFSRQAEGYTRLTVASGGVSAAFMQHVRLAPADQVLDVCCGPGALALDLAAHAAHVTGLDLTPAMLDEARAAQARRGVENVAWRQGDVCRLPFEDGAFSLVTSSTAFHHLEDPRRAFAEMVRVCRPGGRIMVRDVTPAAAKSEGYDGIEKLRDPSHTHALTPQEMRGLGDGLPVGEPDCRGAVSSDLPIEPILAASFPETCTIDDVRALILEDACSGENRLGLSAKVVDGELRVSYPTTTAVWIRR